MNLSVKMMLLIPKSTTMRPQEFTIKDLENFSGIKAHTIRIWEQRYGILSPDRTDTNIRKYNDTDLKSLLNISLLNSLGHKISNIAKLSDDQIREMINKHAHSNNTEEHFLHMLKISMRPYATMTLSNWKLYLSLDKTRTETFGVPPGEVLAALWLTCWKRATI
jgi:DNA-binding transcriptional MerR regulator